MSHLTVGRRRRGRANGLIVRNEDKLPPELVPSALPDQTGLESGPSLPPSQANETRSKRARARATSEFRSEILHSASRCPPHHPHKFWAGFNPPFPPIIGRFGGQKFWGSPEALFGQASSRMKRERKGLFAELVIIGRGSFQFCTSSRRASLTEAPPGLE